MPLRVSDAGEAEVGEILEIIEERSDAERPVGRFRLIAAAVSIVGAVWVLAVTRGAPLAWLLAASVAAAALFWWRRFAAVERAHLGGVQRRLVLGGAGLALETGSARTALSWSAVERIELDHDRMVVEVVHRGGSLILEPPLGGLGLEALGRKVQAARARGLSNDRPGAHNSAPRDVPTPPPRGARS
jgi:hypothetical protein